MAEQKSAEAIVALAEAAMASTGGSGAKAGVMLIDAALAVAFTTLGERGANEMAGYLAEYIVRQVSHVVGGAGHG